MILILIEDSFNQQNDAKFENLPCSIFFKEKYNFKNNSTIFIFTLAIYIHITIFLRNSVLLQNTTSVLVRT